MLERDVLRQCRDYLKWKGYFVIRIQQGLGCHKGITDLIAIKDGITYFVEVKGENGHLSDYQEQFRRDIQEHKGTYIWVNSLDQLRELLEY